MRIYQIYPLVGTSSFGALSEESAIDSRLNNNAKNTSPELSYGVFMIFEINEKLAIRIGTVHNSLEKSTLDVPIDPNNLNTNYANIENAENSNNFTFSNQFAAPEEIVFQEKLSYLEIPLDVSYNLWSSGKLSFEVIGGVGVSRLIKNEIQYIRASGQSTVLGKTDRTPKVILGSIWV